jgi:glycosyltransferase involved in cell wall biosynthesis
MTARHYRLRILFLTAEYPPYVWGGLGRYSSEAVDALREIARVDVLNIPSYYRTFVGQNGGLPDGGTSIQFRREKHGDVAVHAFLDESLDLFHASPSDLHTAVKDAFQALSSVARSHLASTYDVIYAQDYYTAPLAVHLHLDGTGRKLVVMCHLPVYAGFTYFDKPHSDEVHQTLEAVGVRLADAVIAPSEFTKRILTVTHSVHPDSITVIGEGVAPALTRDINSVPLPIDNLRILSMGRIVDQKGWHYTADVLSALHRLEIPFTFSLIGRGPQDSQLTELFQSAGLDGVVERIRGVDHATALSMYATADVFLSTALYETFGLTVMEAMSRGCIPVTFEIPSLVELIGDAGITVPVGDAEEIARSIALLAADGKLRASLVERCHARAELFTWARHAEALVDLLEKLA